MENKDSMKDLLNEGLGKLNDLKANLEKLTNTSAEVAKEKATEVVDNVTAEAQKTFSQLEEKAAQMMNSEEFKNMEAEGQKVVQEAQQQITEITGKAVEAVNEFSKKFSSIFNKEDEAPKA